MEKVEEERDSLKQSLVQATRESHAMKSSKTESEKLLREELKTLEAKYKAKCQEVRIVTQRCLTM